MAIRKVIEIDRDTCDGCGLCTTACAEGALDLDEDSKAVLLKEIFCDGLGACLDVCPTGALKIVERTAEPYDASLAYEHVLETRGKDAANHVRDLPAPERRSPLDAPPASPPFFTGWPGSLARETPDVPSESKTTDSARSELRHWPIQLRLVSPQAPYLRACDLLIAADCTAFSLGSFHHHVLSGKKLVIACPKLDDTANCVHKIAAIIKHNSPRSLTVATMTVPCCSALCRIVERALDRSGLNIPLRKQTVTISGQLLP